LLEKAQAAKQAGSTLFLVSEENSQLTIYKQETTTSKWGRPMVRQVAVQVSAEEYIETNVGIDVELVHDVEDLLRLAAA